MSSRKGYHRAPSTNAAPTIISEGVELDEIDDPELKTAYEGHTAVRIRSNDRALWLPFSHSRAALGAFIVSFAVLLVTLTAIFGYSQTNKGLIQADEKIYYLW